jgi:hypothetical protein
VAAPAPRIRDLLAVPTSSPEWPTVKQELYRCAELRRKLLRERWGNCERPMTSMTSVAFIISAVTYFLPTLGWFCNHVFGAALPLRRLFLWNLSVGWTGIGWFICFGTSSSS